MGFEILTLYQSAQSEPTSRSLPAWAPPHEVGLSADSGKVNLFPQLSAKSLNVCVYIDIDIWRSGRHHALTANAAAGYYNHMSMSTGQDPAGRGQHQQIPYYQPSQGVSRSQGGQTSHGRSTSTATVQPIPNQQLPHQLPLAHRPSRSQRRLTPYSRPASTTSSQATPRRDYNFTTPLLEVLTIRPLTEEEMEEYLKLRTLHILVSEKDKKFHDWIARTDIKLTLYLTVIHGPYLEIRSEHMTETLMQKAATNAGAELREFFAVYLEIYYLMPPTLELCIPCMSLNKVHA